jgi:hypothetical protein
MFIIQIIKVFIKQGQRSYLFLKTKNKYPYYIVFK